MGRARSRTPRRARVFVGTPARGVRRAARCSSQPREAAERTFSILPPSIAVPRTRIVCTHAQPECCAYAMVIQCPYIPPAARVQATARPSIYPCIHTRAPPPDVPTTLNECRRRRPQRAPGPRPRILACAAAGGASLRAPPASVPHTHARMRYKPVGRRRRPWRRTARRVRRRPRTVPPLPLPRDP